MSRAAAYFLGERDGLLVEGNRLIAQDHGGPDVQVGTGFKTDRGDGYFRRRLLFPIENGIGCRFG
jgi:hypothetical protein